MMAISDTSSTFTVYHCHTTIATITLFEQKDLHMNLGLRLLSEMSYTDV